MEITINGKAYKIKYTIRALFIYEQITGKIFSMKTLTDEYIFFYSLIMANNPDSELTFDSFINAIDENPKLMKKYNKFMLEENKKQVQLLKSGDEDEAPDSKKKL